MRLSLKRYCFAFVGNRCAFQRACFSSFNLRGLMAANFVCPWSLVIPKRSQINYGIGMREVRFFSGLSVSAEATESTESPLLPPQSEADRGKLTLLLDLDETLVHSSVNKPKDKKPDLEVRIEGGIFYCFVRPKVSEFLRHLAKKNFEVAIFTSSTRDYAEQVIDFIDTEHIIKHKLFRESMAETSYGYHVFMVKDLATLGRDLNRLVLVDNSIFFFFLQPNNGIPIKSWLGYDLPDEDPLQDEELVQILPLLDELENVPDVRPLLKEKFNSEDQHKRILEEISEADR